MGVWTATTSVYESKTVVTLSSKLVEGYVIFAQLDRHFFHLQKYRTWLLILPFLQREQSDELLHLT